MSVSMKTPRQRIRTLTAWLLPVLLLGGCRDGKRPLRLADLTPAEEQYITRFVTLERARAVVLVDREAGDALLDSLAASWGDSSLVEAQAALTGDANRLEKLHTLLSMILDAEEDSLLAAPVARRLHAPVLDPPPQAPPPDVSTGE